jgi:carboxyl-terminal processing protease
MNKLLKNFCLFTLFCVVGYISIIFYKGDGSSFLNEVKKEIHQLAFNRRNQKDQIQEHLVANSSKNVSRDGMFKMSLESSYSNEYEKLFNEVLERIKIGYIENVSEKELIEAALNGMLTSLDPHSSYMKAEDFKEMQVQTKGEFGGLGIEITMENSFVKVISPIEGTPAYEAGLKSGDYITNIDNQSVVGMSLIEAVKLMRGKPNTRVRITILREGEKNPIEFRIKRGIIKIKAVRARREGDIAYVKINSFTEQAYSGMIKEFTKIENQIGKKKLAGLVLDLRGNPGGLLDQSILIAESFLNKGDIILSVKGKEGKELNIYKAEKNEDLVPGVPMVVLINEGSASASEIVAGALQDNKRAVVMGTKSFGKGSVQSIIPVEMGGAIKMTIARYYTPSGRSIQAEGIQPDILVRSAKIETIEDKWVSSEKALKGHLENHQSTAVQRTTQLITDNQSLYDKDYQLARAVDLLLGINFYKQN